MLPADCAASARAAFCAYCSARCRSSAVTRGRSNAQTCARKSGISSARAGQRQGQNSGCGVLRLEAFLGIVVDEDEAFEPEVEFGCERGKVGAFRIPIDAAGGEILEAQGKFGMGAEGFGDVFFVVLAAEREQHAFGAARGHEFLQGAARGIERDAGRAVFAADAAPKGVVAIERDDFVGRVRERVNLARDGGGKRREEERRVGEMAEFARVRIVCIGDGLGVCEVDGRGIGESSADEAAGGLGCGFVPRRRRAESDDQRRGERSGGTYGIDEMAGGFLHACGDPIVETDEGDVEAVVAREEAIGREQFLEKLVIRREANVVGQREFGDPEGERGLDGFGGEGCGDGDRAIVGGHEPFIMKQRAR